MTIDFNRPGRMISSSKTGPKSHICVFNANICTNTRGKIWFGDIDLTTDGAELSRLAKEVGETIYVLREWDARFLNEAKPVFKNAVAGFYPDGTVDQFQTR